MDHLFFRIFINTESGICSRLVFTNFQAVVPSLTLTIETNLLNHRRTRGNACALIIARGNEFVDYLYNNSIKGLVNILFNLVLQTLISKPALCSLIVLQYQCFSFLVTSTSDSRLFYQTIMIIQELLDISKSVTEELYSETIDPCYHCYTWNNN